MLVSPKLVCDGSFTVAGPRMCNMLSALLSLLDNYSTSDILLKADVYY